MTRTSRNNHWPNDSSESDISYASDVSYASDISYASRASDVSYASTLGARPPRRCMAVTDISDPCHSESIP
jgi:hypothetical protein